MASAATSNRCIICNEPSSLRCGRCKDASYCSQLCQKGDFPIHKLLCKSFAEFDLKTRPTDVHYRAVLFPTDHKTPQLIWLHCPWQEPEDEDETRYQLADIEQYLNASKPRTLEISTAIQNNPVLGRRLSHTVCVSYRDTFLVDGSEPNKSVETINTQAPWEHIAWRGPIIGHAMVGTEFECKDMDMTDFRHIADFFNSYAGNRVPSTPDVHPGISPKVRGVKINCIGDQKMFKKPPFEEIELSPSDPIFNKLLSNEFTQPPEIPKRIGVPILTRRCFPHPNWANDKGLYDNVDATYLHLCCNPAPEGVGYTVGSWGWAPPQWQDYVGSVIIVRQDQKPLSAWHAEALCRFCREDACQYMAHANRAYLPEKPMSKDMALSIMCQPVFSVFFDRNTREKNEKEGTRQCPHFPY